MRCRTRSAAASLVAFALCGMPAANAADDGGWQFEVSPYIWGAGLEGTSGVPGVEADIDVGFDDIWDNLDAALMGTVEARRGNWMILLDGLYMKLEDDKSRSWTGPGGIGSLTGDLEVTPTLQMYGLVGGYRVTADDIKIDLLAGARYTRVDMDLDLTVTTGGLLPGGTRSISGDESWWDPIVGIRIVIPFAEKWAGVLYADYGGFGVGSDSTYQLMVGVNWYFSKHFALKAGYRYLYQDFEDDDDEFKWDMTAQGPYLGIGIRF